MSEKGDEAGKSYPEFKLAALFEKDQLHSSWKEELQSKPLEEPFSSADISAGLQQGKISSSASFKKPLLDGWDQPALNPCNNQAEKCQDKNLADSQSSCKETYELVALGTGDVCYEGWMEFNGRRVHDMHGMVVARRALLRQDPAALEKCIFCPAGDGVHLTLKPKYYLHLYLSRTPSGTSENFQTRLSQPNPAVGLHVSIKGELRPVSYCRPSVLSSYVYCVSGSDKLTRWSFLGVQGALLSHILLPVYITSIVLADPYQDPATLHWVINDRLKLGPEDTLPKSYSRKQVYLLEGPRVAPIDAPPDCCSWSLNWCGGDEMLEFVKGTAGKAVRDISDPGDQYRPSRLCKAAMLSLFRKIAREMKREDLVLLPTYHQAKVQAEIYQSAKRQVYAQLSLQGYGKWPQKQLVDIFAS
ncbi:hypothetical protein JD844_005998 [Phrynosoma platyrhinos]|uniref:A to I editase domain-containing protein n=1 Tax=Phrynosoma platyrhinos TaxID=52577 RepID=A0ABQ7TPM6_PHRPL|nr:hypothetical protein JD844_005998 [Phrynosoma platyrhinos]